MEILVSFGEGMRVDARFRDHVVHTDQPKHVGGDDSAPSPLELFLTSLATCAGLYVLRCQQHQHGRKSIEVRDRDLTQQCLPGSASRPGSRDFPPRTAVCALPHCAVKHLQHPPQIIL